jgi:catechol 2,3-dioxygenase-like lactoylglutathione lyase family enzyme
MDTGMRAQLFAATSDRYDGGPTFARTSIMKRFHIALAVADLDQSIADYSERLGQAPTVVVPSKYAMWRTDLLNFSINELLARAGQLRHVGFEDDNATGYQASRDVNGLEWEWFSAEEQDRRIVETYGAARR